MTDNHTDVNDDQNEMLDSNIDDNEETDAISCDTSDKVDLEFPESNFDNTKIQQISNYEEIEASQNVSDLNVTKTYLEKLICDLNFEPEDMTYNEENLDEYLDIDNMINNIQDTEDYLDSEEFDKYCFDEEENCSDSIQTIYHGHDMPVWVSMLMILLHMITNSVSKREIESILVMISAHCLEAHPGLQSLYHFKKHFASLSSPLKKHFYCVSCLACVNEDANICVNQYCLKNLTSPKSKSYFIELPIKEQLQILFNRVNFTTLLLERFKRDTNNTNTIKDIYDGKIYQAFSRKGGQLSEEFPNNISFILNTDGVTIFKSSKFSIWPIYLMVNELPYKNRKQVENMVLAGLWFGDSKPLMSTFLKPIYQSLQELEGNGIDLTVGENIINVKAYLLCTAADLPAKSLLMNMNQFNGEYSCGKCLQKGQTFRTNKGGSVHIFPYKINDNIEARTKTACIANAIKAREMKTTANGIKGPSFLMGLQSYDYVEGASIYYMHGVLLGVTKLLIKLWISSPFSKEDFSLMEYADVIDQRLLSIRPPKFITRVPRSISSHFKYWKASELRSWLFFYALPVLNDIMEDCYYLHFAALVEALNYLCGDNISFESVDKSERLIKYFVMMFSTLYGERYMTLNVHQLLHLPDCVRNIGPLWAYSCFSFENANGELNRLFHGTQNIELQILSSVNIIHHLPSLLESLPDRYREIFQKLYPGRMTKAVNSFHIQFLGRKYTKELPHYILEQLLPLLGMVPPNMEFYSRMIFRGQVFHSKEYDRAVKRNSYTVKYFCSETKMMRYGFIQYFGVQNSINCGMDLDECSNTQFFAFLIPVEKLGSITRNTSINNALQITVPHIHPCRSASSKICVIKLENIISICAYVSFQNGECGFVCEPANTFEAD